MINQTGVGQLVKIVAKKGNKTRPCIKLGICGDPDSVKFCHQVGLTYLRGPFALSSRPSCIVRLADAKPKS